jgi:glycosyltransferase involved in cell wall biosynthesis
MEGASATIREAMFLGVPCIASARGGMTNLIDNGISGYTYDYNDYKTLSNLIITLFEDEKKSTLFFRKIYKVRRKNS